MGSIMENANITVRVSILDPELLGTAGGGVVYSEIQKTGKEAIQENVGTLNHFIFALNTKQWTQYLK